MIDYFIVDYNETVNLAQIVRTILDGYEIDIRTDDPDLDYAVYTKDLGGNRDK